jgi:hypothetical protein
MFVGVQSMLKGLLMPQYFCVGRFVDVLFWLFPNIVAKTLKLMDYHIFSNFRYNQRIVREYTIWMMSCEKDTCDGFFLRGSLWVY